MDLLTTIKSLLHGSPNPNPQSKEEPQMNFAFLENLIVKYLEAHPELVERLVTDLFQALLKKIENPPPTA